MWPLHDKARAPGWPAAVAAGLAALLLAAQSQALNADEGGAGAKREAPATLFETGLYSDPDSLIVDPAHIGFEPQYPLWTDGAEKRRWIALPPGTAVDATDADAWEFPIGTRMWKEFAFAGERVETRYMERLSDGSWLFAAYAWDDDRRAARRVSEKGRRNAYSLTGGAAHTIPSAADCRACHLSGAAPVLGFTARQLARDGEIGPAVTEGLRALVERGVLSGYDPKLEAGPPAVTRLERRALGYLHGNCGHCHNAEGPLAKLGLNLRQPAAGAGAGALASVLGQPLKSPPPGLARGTEHRILAGYPELSAVPQRMASRWPALQMPPLGTAMVDADGVELITRWISEMEAVSTKVRQDEGDEE